MGVLSSIVEAKRIEVLARAVRRPIAVLSAALDGPPTRDFAAAIRRPAGGSIRTIAEIKRRSPSRGVLRETLDPGAAAREYEQCGAAALSVLTDQPYFGGSDEDLQAARAATSRPVLRKDFTIDEYQIHEGRAIGADAVLLIARLLTPAQLRDWLRVAKGLGIAALVETHDEHEVRVAVDAGAKIVGVNSRDLNTLEVDLGAALRLRPHIPPGCIAVAESGIRSRADVIRLEQAGFDAMLVGESLLTAARPGAKLAELLGGDVP